MVVVWITKNNFFNHIFCLIIMTEFTPTIKLLCRLPEEQFFLGNSNNIFIL